MTGEEIDVVEFTHIANRLIVQDQNERYERKLSELRSGRMIESKTGTNSAEEPLEETTSFSNLEGEYYAKIKGWELVPEEEDLIYWSVTDDKLYIDDNTGKIGPYGKRRSALTLKEWEVLGITDANAEFERVK